MFLYLFGTASQSPDQPAPSLLRRLVSRLTTRTTEAPSFVSFCQRLHVDLSDQDAIDAARETYRASYGVDPD